MLVANFRNALALLQGCLAVLRLINSLFFDRSQGLQELYLVSGS